MQTFGIMTLHLKNEQSYIEGVAKAVVAKNFECFRFIPSHIQPTTLLVKGERYIEASASWEAADFPIPQLIYDRCFYGDDAHSKRCANVVKWLKAQHDITFLGYGLPNKMELYEVLSKTKLHPYLLPSTLVQTPEQVIQTLITVNPAVMKPIDGSGGNGIYFIKREMDHYTVETDKKGEHIKRQFESKDQLLLWLQSLLKKKTFLIQAYKQLTSAKGEPFDLRSLLQKDSRGKWRLVGKGVRVGTPGSIVSNLSAGGHVFSFDTWLNESSISSKSFLLKEIGYILSLLPKVLEDSFPPLFEIGVDLGIAKDGSLWILDVNSKPGRKVVLATAAELRDSLYAAPISYGLHLLETERSSASNEKIISN